MTDRSREPATTWGGDGGDRADPQAIVVLAATGSGRGQKGGRPASLGCSGRALVILLTGPAQTLGNLR